MFFFLCFLVFRRYLLLSIFLVVLQGSMGSVAFFGLHLVHFD